MNEENDEEDEEDKEHAKEELKKLDQTGFKSQIALSTSQD